MAYVDRVNVDGLRYDAYDKEAVHFAQSQSLTTAQKEQARNNVGAASKSDVETLNSEVADLKTYVRGMPPLATLSGGVVAVSDAAPLDAEDVLVNIEPVQSGSGDPSPDNVRPITGWTGAKVTRCGKNLGQISEDILGSNQYISAQYNEGSVVATATGNYGRVGYLFNVKAGQKYCVSYKANGFGDFIRIVYGELDAAWSSTTPGFWKFQLITQEETNYQYSFTATDSGLFFFGLYVSANGYEGTYIQISDFQLELGSVATEYEPYLGDTYSITFPAEAGTVYGGTLDVTTGLLTVNRAIFTDSGNGGWIKSATTSIDRFVINTGIPGVNSDDIISNEFNYGLTGNNTFYIDLLGANGAVRAIVNYTQYGTTTLEGFKAFLNENPVQFLIKLATPVTYQLDPVAIAMLRGENTLWADTGNITLAYRQDVGLLLESLINGA